MKDATRGRGNISRRESVQRTHTERSPHHCRPPKVSSNLSYNDAVRIYEALDWVQGKWPSWQSVTINYDLLGCPCDMDSFKKAVVDNLYHWLKSKGVPPFYCVVRECGPNLGNHFHILTALPPGQGPELSRMLWKWLQAQRIGGKICKGVMQSRKTEITGYLGYVLKTLTRSDAEKFFHKTGVRISIEHSGPPLTGRRIGLSRALQSKARAKYDHESCLEMGNA